MLLLLISECKLKVPKDWKMVVLEKNVLCLTLVHQRPRCLLRRTFKHKLMSVPMPGEREADAYGALTSSELKSALPLVWRDTSSSVRAWPFSCTFHHVSDHHSWLERITLCFNSGLSLLSYGTDGW